MIGLGSFGTEPTEAETYAIRISLLFPLEGIFDL